MKDMSDYGVFVILVDDAMYATAFNSNIDKLELFKMQMR